MTAIRRQPELAEQGDFDLIILGGGPLGILLTLQAARRGYRPLLVSQGDVNRRPGFHPPRVLPDGTDALRRGDFRGCLDAIQERRWFLHHFPEAFTVLPCLQPIPAHGPIRRAIARLADPMHRLASARRNAGLAESVRLPRAKRLTAEQARTLEPELMPERSRGAILRHDAFVQRPNRLMVEALRWAVAIGATVLNHCRPQRILEHGGHTTGLEATDRIHGQTHTFAAPAIIDTAGHDTLHPHQASTRKPPASILAFELLLQQARPIQHALTLGSAFIKPTATRGSAKPRSLRLTPRSIDGRQRLLAGTFHVALPRDASEPNPQPTNAQLEQALDQLNAAAPALTLGPADVLRIVARVLPAEPTNAHVPIRRPRWTDHTQHGGPIGTLSVQHAHDPTARLVAEQTLRRVFGQKLRHLRRDARRPDPETRVDFERFTADANTPNALRQLADAEAVCCLNDLIHGRTEWAADPAVNPDWCDPLRRVFDLPDTITD